MAKIELVEIFFKEDKKKKLIFLFKSWPLILVISSDLYGAKTDRKGRSSFVVNLILFFFTSFQFSDFPRNCTLKLDFSSELIQDWAKNVSFFLSRSKQVQIAMKKLNASGFSCCPARFHVPYSKNLENKSNGPKA